MNTLPSHPVHPVHPVSPSASSALSVVPFPTPIAGAVVPTTPVLDTEVLDGWSEFERWLKLWRKTARADVALQIMLGLLLNALHKDYEIRAGRPAKEFRHCGGINEQLSWPERLAQYNVSETTARRWRMMADGIKPRIKKLGGQERLRALLELHPRDWTDEESALIESAVAHCTDGYTQSELMLELGIAKRPTGSGGARPRPEQPITATDLAQDQQRAAYQQSAELLETLSHMGDAYLQLHPDQLGLIAATLAAHRKALAYLIGPGPQPIDPDHFRRLLAGKA